MIDSRFRHAEEEFVRLRRELAAGHITAEELEKALDAAMIEHDGRYWMLGANSGKWYVSDGQAWREVRPPIVPEARPASAPIDRPAPGVPPAGAAPAYAAAPPVYAPPPTRSKTSARTVILGGALGCVAPFLAAVGAFLLFRGYTLFHRAFELGALLFGAAAFLVALCLTALLRKIPLLVLLALYVVGVFGFVAMARFGSSWGITTLTIVIGIAVLVGMLCGALLRKWR